MLAGFLHLFLIGGDALLRFGNLARKLRVLRRQTGNLLIQLRKIKSLLKQCAGFLQSGLR
ncbi:hypothetical protein D3C76_1778240 [compost metagenome]